MQDPYAGLAGTFYTDPDTGMRIPQAEWEAAQAHPQEPLKAGKKPVSAEEPN